MKSVRKTTVTRWVLVRLDGGHQHVEWGAAHTRKKIAIAFEEGRLRRELRGCCTPEEIEEAVRAFHRRINAGTTRAVRVRMELLP